MLREEQARRFKERQTDPLKQWKLSPIDLASFGKWEEYTRAKEEMFFHTDTADAPWTVIKSDNKMIARLNCMRFVLDQIPYEGKDEQVVGRPILRSWAARASCSSAANASSRRPVLKKPRVTRKRLDSPRLVATPRLPAAATAVSTRPVH